MCIKHLSLSYRNQKWGAEFRSHNSPTKMMPFNGGIIIGRLAWLAWLGRFLQRTSVESACWRSTGVSILSADWPCTTRLRLLRRTAWDKLVSVVYVRVAVWIHYVLHVSEPLGPLAPCGNTLHSHLLARQRFQPVNLNFANVLRCVMDLPFGRFEVDASRGPLWVWYSRSLVPKQFRRDSRQTSSEIEVSTSVLPWEDSI